MLPIALHFYYIVTVGYSLLKIYARFMLRIYAPRIYYRNQAVLREPGPILLACNHPNSFLDGVILTTMMDTRLYSLARGDAFRNPRHGRWLRRLHLLPVYRMSEGAENLTQNYDTFDECLQAFREGHSVLIFSEGGCVNEWHLRPLRKGTARLTLSALEQKIPLKVIPVGINYDSFRTFGKEIHILFGTPLQTAEIMGLDGEGNRLNAFNDQLRTQLTELVYEIPPGDESKRKSIFKANGKFYPLFLLPLAVLGWLLHLPIYLPAKAVADKHFSSKQIDHYDSVWHAIFLLAYPLLIIIYGIVLAFIHPAFILFLLTLPVLARAQVLQRLHLDTKKTADSKATCG